MTFGFWTRPAWVPLRGAFRARSIAIGRWCTALVAATALAACSSTEASPEPRASSSAKATGSSSAPGKVEWVKFPAGTNASTWVKSELERAKADQKKLVLYVGAKWCEPCQNFHEATERGELDAAFPDLRLVAFDHDDEADTIAELGCGSHYIPMFSVPDSNGHCSRQQIQGGIKGTSNVAFLTEKLRGLIGP